MWLPLDTDWQYRLEGAISPAAFFEHLPLLVASVDTVVLGCYDARQDVHRFLVAESLPDSEQHFRPNDTFEHNRKEHPTGAAFHLRASTETLRQLACFAQSVDRTIDLCDHIAAYSAKHPLLIYHGAFREPLFVSTRIDRRQVEAFARAVGASCQEIDFDTAYFPDV